MDEEDAKSWMLLQGKCEEWNCPSLLSLPDTRDDPAERSCTRRGKCPYDEVAQLRFSELRAEFMEEALAESWEGLVGPLKGLLEAPKHGYGAIEGAVMVLQEHAGKLIDNYILDILKKTHEI